MPLPLSVVVITTYNRRPILERTLDALAAQTERDFRIVVVDDGSADDTWDFLQTRAAGDPGLEVLRQENRGQGQARNHALSRVGGGLVLFLGDDVIPRPGFIAEHRAGHEGTGDGVANDGELRGVVGFTDWCRADMRVTPLLEMINTQGHQFGYAHMTPHAEVPFTCFYTSNLSLPREALGDDPFDAAFAGYGWEDVELGYRLSRRGLKLIYRPEAAAEHLHPMDLAAVFARQRQCGRTVDTLLRLHPDLAGSPLLAPLAPPRWFPLGKRLVPPLLPLLGALDRRRVDLSIRVLHRVLQVGYYLGREESARARTVGGPAIHGAAA